MFIGIFPYLWKKILLFDFLEKLLILANFLCFFTNLLVIK